MCDLHYNSTCVVWVLLNVYLWGGVALKKSMVFLISALTFMIGLAGGIVAGIFLSPVKNGMDTKIYFLIW